jgi:spore germination protein GerM
MNRIAPPLRRLAVVLLASVAAMLAACDRAQEQAAVGTAGTQHATPPSQTTVSVYFTRGEERVAVQRHVSAAAPLAGALRALLAGPTAEERATGIHSWFSDETASMLRSVTIADGGATIIDFADFSSIIPNASTSAGSAMLLGELNHTVFEFPEIATVEYRFEGSCAAFFNWLQADCQPIARGEHTTR